MPTPTLNRCQKTPLNKGQALPPEIQVSAETNRAKIKTELWRATETNRLTRRASQTKQPIEQTEAKTKQGKSKNQTANEKRKPEANQKTARHHRS